MCCQFFDDMREIGIRASITDVFKQAHVVGRLEKVAIGRKLLANYGDQNSAGNDMAALENTMQERVEKYLDTQLGSVWQTWNDRPALRGEIFISLYKFRNWLFGINPSSIRKMIPGRYATNRQALEATLESAREQRIRVLLYIVPLRMMLRCHTI